MGTTMTRRIRLACESCDYTAEMEPDQDQGFCEVCGGNTVTSALVLAGLI